MNNMDSFLNYITVDLDALQENFRKIKAISGVPAMAVIKADAYGHGAVAAAKALADEAAFFGVASITEAMELRNAGIENPILVLGHMPTSAFSHAVRLNVRPAIFNYEDACALSQEAQKQGVTAQYHLVADTGMSRIGFQVTEESADICGKIAQLPHLDCEGIFSHFATADEADLTAAHAQADLFDQFCQMLETRGVKPRIRHLDNSAGILNFAHHYDMVRAGIILYGLCPSDEVPIAPAGLKPVLSWKAQIAHLKTLEASRKISYGGTYTTTAPTRVATIPVGYADGYRRGLSNQFHVMIRGQKAPILGRVCMDQLMVDVTHIDGVTTADTVTLLGEGITAEEMAQALGTINYEIVCGISRRVPRVYLHQGQVVEIVNYLL